MRGTGLVGRGTVLETDVPWHRAGAEPGAVPIAPTTLAQGGAR